MKIEGLLVDSKRVCNKAQKLDKLPVAKDIARLARKVSLIMNKNEINFELQKDCSNEDVLFQLLKALGKELQNVDVTKDEFCKKINLNDHYTLSNVSDLHIKI